MPAFDPVQLAAATAGTWTSRPVGPLRGFTQDTRTLQPGQVFVALCTAQRDGHAFLDAALAAGAAAALVARAVPGVALPQLVVRDPLVAFHTIARVHRERFAGPVAGVTGSAGKTSTKDLLALLLGGEDGGVLATEGNLNNFLGVPLTLTRLDRARHRAAVIEAGISEPGEMTSLAQLIQPDVGIVTLVAHAHTQELGGLDGVAREKSELLRHVRAGGRAIFPASCLAYAPFRALGAAATVLQPGPETLVADAPGATVVSFTVRHTTSATELTLAGPEGTRTFRLRRVTRGQAQNAALALVAATHLGRSDAELQTGLDQWRASPLRGEWRTDGPRTLYLDCYNANPASLADALELFMAVAPSGEPRLFLLGGMEELGPEAAALHRTAGRGLHLRPGDQLLLVGALGRELREGALENGNDPAALTLLPEAAAAAPHLAAFSGHVFLKGSRRHRLELALPSATAPAPTSQPSAAPC